MDLIDREELLINCQEAMFLKDLTLEQRAHIIMERLDNAPTVDAVPMSVIDEIKAEIEENYGHCDICEYFEDYDYEDNNISEYRYVANVKDILQIIDKYMKEGEA